MLLLVAEYDRLASLCYSALISIKIRPSISSGFPYRAGLNGQQPQDFSRMKMLSLTKISHCLVGESAFWTFSRWEVGVTSKINLVHVPISLRLWISLSTLCHGRSGTSVSLNMGYCQAQVSVTDQLKLLDLTSAARANKLNLETLECALMLRKSAKSSVIFCPH